MIGRCHRRPTCTLIRPQHTHTRFSTTRRRGVVDEEEGEGRARGSRRQIGDAAVFSPSRLSALQYNYSSEKRGTCAIHPQSPRPPAQRHGRCNPLPLRNTNDSFGTARPSAHIDRQTVACKSMTSKGSRWKEDKQHRPTYRVVQTLPQLRLANHHRNQLGDGAHPSKGRIKIILSRP